MRGLQMYLDLVPQGVTCQWFNTVYDGIPGEPTLRRTSSLAAASGGHIRTGIGENPLLDGKRGAEAYTNVDHVEMAVQMGQLAGREIATPDEQEPIGGHRIVRAEIPLNGLQFIAADSGVDLAHVFAGRQHGDDDIHVTRRFGNAAPSVATSGPPSPSPALPAAWFSPASIPPPWRSADRLPAASHFWSRPGTTRPATKHLSRSAAVTRPSEMERASTGATLSTIPMTRWPSNACSS